MSPNLPEGDYPFMGDRLPLSELVMVEAPIELEKLLQAQAKKNGLEIVRDEPVELSCEYQGFPSATFLVWWPRGERMHMLVPKTLAKGRG